MEKSIGRQECLREPYLYQVSNCRQPPIIKCLLVWWLVWLCYSKKTKDPLYIIMTRKKYTLCWYLLSYIISDGCTDTSDENLDHPWWLWVINLTNIPDKSNVHNPWILASHRHLSTCTSISPDQAYPRPCPPWQGRMHILNMHVNVIVCMCVKFVWFKGNLTLSYEVCASFHSIWALQPETLDNFVPVMDVSLPPLHEDFLVTWLPV